MESSYSPSSFPSSTPTSIQATVVDANGGTNGDTIEHVVDDSSSLPSQDLPFLITHWLSRYESNSNNNNTINNSNSRDGDIQGNERKKAEALRKISRATSELASAFSDLGEFGYSLAVSLNTRR